MADGAAQVGPDLDERADELEDEIEANRGTGPDDHIHWRDAAVPKTHAEGAVVIEGGRALGYAAYGDPEGDAVLWFHGTPGARKQVPPDIEREAVARGFRVIGIDRPGTGLSTPHGYGHVSDWAADVEVVADALGIDRFGVVGMSGGGPYALAACHGLPDRVVAGAVLGGVGPLRGPEAAPGFLRLAAPFEPLLSLVRIPVGELLTQVVRPVIRFGSPMFEVYARICPASDRRVLHGNPELKALFLNDIETAAAGGLRAVANDAVLFTRDWGFSLRDVHVPVRFWQGDEDGIVPFGHGEAQAALVPDAELIVCHGGGHFAGFLLAPDVLTWIDGCWPDRARAAAS